MKKDLILFLLWLHYNYIWIDDYCPPSILLEIYILLWGQIALHLDPKSSLFLSIVAVFCSREPIPNHEMFPNPAISTLSFSCSRLEPMFLMTTHKSKSIPLDIFCLNHLLGSLNNLACLPQLVASQAFFQEYEIYCLIQLLASTWQDKRN